LSRDHSDTQADTAHPAGPAADGTGRVPELAELAGRDYQELWFALSRQPWRSVVLVPVEAGLRADELATALAGIGRRLGFTQVSAVVADQIEFATVGQLAARVAAPGQASGSAAIGGGAQVIVSIPPVVVQPLGVAVARAADAVVLCLAVGETSVGQVARTIELVGRERIRGAVVLPPVGA